MLTYKVALDLLMQAVPKPRPELVPLSQAAGRALAQRVLADRPLPPFNKSFMDGYAIRAADCGSRTTSLRVVGLQPAGTLKGELSVGSGQAVQIMTGAPLPRGADAVQMVEKSRRLSGDMVEILEPVRAGENVSPRGDEVREGEIVLEAGRFIGPPEVAVLATFGVHQVPVYRRPRVALFATGDELVEAEDSPGPGQIRNSNGPMLQAQCARLGALAAPSRHLPDTPEAVSESLQAAEDLDVLLFSGGVSAGEYDFVHRVLPKAGCRLIFHKVAIKPGKPLLAAERDGRVVFGLPGNPVSAFVTFELFVRPALQSLMGCPKPGLPTLQGTLTKGFRNRPGRLFFKPARVWTDGQVRIEPIETRGSADIVGFASANALIVTLETCPGLDAGERAEVLLLPDFEVRGGGD